MPDLSSSLSIDKYKNLYSYHIQIFSLNRFIDVLDSDSLNKQRWQKKRVICWSGTKSVFKIYWIFSYLLFVLIIRTPLNVWDMTYESGDKKFDCHLSTCCWIEGCNIDSSLSQYCDSHVRMCSGAGFLLKFPF